MQFPENFVWGVATSAYQIEGAAFEGGKGPSLWDSFSHCPGKIFEGHTGDVACDHYHRFREDVAQMAELGVKAYRFSVSWPRVLPEGTGRVNEEGVQFYSDLVDELLRRGITPYVTLYHWDLPLALYHKGGWMSPDSPAWFAEYAALMGRRLGDRVKHFITFNEPQVFIGKALVDGVGHAPAYQLGQTECLLAAHHVLLAHGKGAQALRAAVPGAQIGFAPTCDMRVPASESAGDIEAARKAFFAVPEGRGWAWNPAWWSDPVVLGHYPEDGLRILEPVLPHFGADDLKTICQPLDFYGQNIYRGIRVRQGEDGRPQELPYPPGSPKTAIGWHVDFDCLYWGARFFHERYRKPICITESGMSSHDWISLDGKVHDPQRIDYLQRHLQGLRRACGEGVEVAGYFQWSFMDNFEWAEGYNDRFGLVYVDYETQRRVPKDSFYWYKQVIASNGAVL